MVDKKFITTISGKEFVTFEGLLDEFHKAGGKSIETEMLQSQLNEKTLFVFKAIVEGERGKFIGHGDACEGNVGGMIKPHMMRMAETRAIARALRLYNNIGMCSAEELS